METTEKQGKLVQMRLSEETLERIERLKVLLGYKGNKTQLIVDVLRFAEELIKEVRNGNEIHIHYENGKEDNILLPKI